MPGLPAMCMKAMCSSGCRLGFYTTVRDKLPGDGVGTRMLAGGITGGIGCAIFNPIEVVRVRMLSPTPYPSTLGAFAAVAKAEGAFAGLWRGVGPYTASAILFSGAQLATYESTKKFLLFRRIYKEEALSVHIVASFVSGLCAATLSHPVATLKAVVMDSRGASCGALVRLRALLAEGGPARLFCGLGPALAVKAPGMVVYLPVVEQLRHCVFGVGYI